jgi:alginate O-acetyltransferase complex protein AlgI
MFGFHFLENFNYPYIATSITEFWRRWHISLSSWFRDYIYIPLGGNRAGALRQYRNIFIVWLLTGFWHGAEWTFVIWGLYFGILLVIEKKGLGRLVQRAPVALQHLYAMLLVVISWTIFSADNLSACVTTLKGMFFMGHLPAGNAQTVYYLCANAVLLLLAIVGATPVPKRLCKHLPETVKIVALFGILMMCIAYLVSASFNPFLYFRF